ncbi:MAG: peptidase, partial [Acidobacteriaceae bacterium]|nr:peptidase [Acidobacteriaceae bacterium]
PILDRGVESHTSLETAAKYALLSFDATIRSNVTVGPPVEIVLYRNDTFELTQYRRFSASDADLSIIHASWETSLRRAVEQLPEIEFRRPPPEVAASTG